MAFTAWSNRQFAGYYLDSPFRSPLFWTVGVMSLINVTLGVLMLARAHGRLPWTAEVAFGALILAAVLPLPFFAHPRVRKAVTAVADPPRELLRELAGVTFALASLVGFGILVCLQVIGALVAR